MAIDYTSPDGQVRLLIADTDEEHLTFENDAIDGFLALTGGDVLLAAAQALDTIATSESLVLKVMTTLDVTTDGAKLADSLRKGATTLREQAINGIDGGGDFEIAEMVVDPHTFAERYFGELMRQSTEGGWPFWLPDL